MMLIIGISLFNFPVKLFEIVFAELYAVQILKSLEKPAEICIRAVFVYIFFASIKIIKIRRRGHPVNIAV